MTLKINSLEKLRVQLNTESIANILDNEMALDLNEYNIDKILTIRAELFPGNYISPSFHYNTISKIAYLKIDYHTKIIIDFYSVMLQRDLKLKQLLN